LAAGGAEAGRGVGSGADAVAGGRGAGGAGDAPGSGFMMLTGGIEVALGNSALVGLPEGVDGGNAASGALAGPAAAGAFHDGA